MKLFGKKKARPYVSAVIAAGGSSTRFGEENKVLAELAGMPVLAHSLLAFDACPLVREIVIVAQGDILVDCSHVAQDYGVHKVTKVIRGGASRQESILSGLGEVSKETEYVVTHDAARPLVSPKLIEEVCEKAFTHTCATAASAMYDTVKRIERGLIVETVDRDSLITVQTPQATDLQLLAGALSEAQKQGITVTDDCMAVERLGIKPAPVLQTQPNWKITVPEDLILIEALMESITG